MVATLIVAVLVLYLAIARPDIQPALATSSDVEGLEAAAADTTGAIGRPGGGRSPDPQSLRGGLVSTAAGDLFASDSLRPVNPRSDP